MEQDREYGGWLKISDSGVAIGTLAVAVWMFIDGNTLTSISLSTFGVIAVLRLQSHGVREWTDEHTWLFFALLTLLALLAVAGVYPVEPLPKKSI
ncbi:hypothetical protein [Haloferax larsenii]|uniref:Uncharacterized protein n=1 Tax=Haloferax larsenii TaxID=302484 RepID=A0A1H7H7N0_HALLR|nr:hypothetical protein [Haloferax larsenii]SEK45767.1 hypothetical protein SAMN04488691_101499 [Haloferax larsenii]